MRVILIAVSGIVLAAAAQRPADFTFDPKPRWTEDPETEKVCEVIARECSGFLKDGSFEGNWGYAELYNADGYLVGLRQVKSTGCKPLDEHMMLGQRHFATLFSKSGPDLDDLTVETAPGTNRDGVRLVKQGETSLSFGC
ncbi:hypothetical protein [Sphingomonas alba]|uniref:DUF2147 domain-containing protein n=1 Tax=Sphingomonas alba TaxID=2908208 RepID=A0ABT0RMI4_9SPHN|nr:hypothetical protein [Sphingomonas alba]MCL6683773.1 hypothetical protein [Sphingomonas alba]